jgi:peptidoglycan/LPS O-acetylase OafA/YrhL
MRLVLASTVAFAHALELGFGYQPSIAGTKLGDLAVDAFFVLSGFLLASSYVRLASIRRYVWHRFLRIMPGFWTCLLLTALLVAPAVAWLQGRPASSVFTGPQSSLDFLRVNSMLMMRQFGISGLPQGVAVPDVVNGSLWTLFYEAVCYAGVVVLGVVGALRRRPLITLAVVGLLWAATALNAAGLHIVGQQRLLRFTLLFLLGSVLFLYGRVVPIRGWLAAASLVLLIVGLIWTTDYRVLAGPGFAYLCLWVAVIRPSRTTPVSDLSYGLYVYHYPILQLLVVSGLTDLGEGPFIAAGLVLSMGAAFASWHMIERPSLSFKDAAWVGSPRTHTAIPLPSSAAGREDPTRSVRGGPWSALKDAAAQL